MTQATAYASVFIDQKSGKMMINKGLPNRSNIGKTLMYHGQENGVKRCFRVW
jgi:hypothetical protein